MITPAYCQTMARYNAWQNKGLRRIVEDMDPEALGKDRGAFFGSIFATLNHLLWGDQLWMARFDGGAGPRVGPKDHLTMTPTAAVWTAERFRTDGRITLWADKLKSIDLVGDLSWHSGSQNRDLVRPKAECIVHFFNHQTHHRGQVHAMLTAAGIKPDVTDLVFMPEP